MPAKKKETVNHPEHYSAVETAAGPVECIDLFEQFSDIRLGTSFRYIWRVDPNLGGGKEDNQEDIEKAIWYLCRYLGYVPETVID